MLKIFIITLLLPFCAFASEKQEEKTIIDQSEPLSLAMAVRQAVKNNPELKSIYYNRLISESAVGQKESDKYIKVNLGASGGFSNNSIIDGNTTDKSYGNAEITMDYLLYDFGALSSNIESAKASLIAVNYTYNAKVRDLVFNVIDAYYYVLKTSDEIKSGELNLKMTKLNYDIASEKYSLGLVALNDKLQTETSYLQSKLDLNKAKAEEKIAKGNLLTLMNMSPDSEVEVFLPEKMVEDNIIDKDIKILIEEAISKRYEIASKKSEIEYYRLEEERISKEYLPKISAFSNIGTGFSDSDYEEKSYSGSIGLRLSVPLFTGYDVTYKKQESTQKYQKSKEDLEVVISEIKSNVWSAYHLYLTSKENYEVSHQLFLSAKQNEKVASGAYKAGKGSMLNLITAQSDLIDARNEKTASLYNFLISRSMLLKEIGYNEMDNL